MRSADTSAPTRRRQPQRRLLALFGLATLLVTAFAAPVAAEPSQPAVTADNPSGDPMFYEGFDIDESLAESTAAAAEAIADYTGPANSANARFVVAAYQGLVGRSADTGGLDYYLGRMTGGGDRGRATVSYALLFSPEGSGLAVQTAYGDILDRSPDSGGAAYWTAHLQGQGVADLQVLLYASDEYMLRAGGNDSAWLDKLYQDVLGRSADAGGKGYWMERRQAGVSRTLVAAAIHQSNESLNRRAAALYQSVLHRSPSPSETAGTAAALRRYDDRTLRAQMWASDEMFETYLQAAWS